MNKQFQGSKKKARRKAFLNREEKRVNKLCMQTLFTKAKEEGDKVTLAQLMG